jgi:hypothetical protein
VRLEAPRAAHDAAETAQVGGLAEEAAILGPLQAVLDEVGGAADERDQRGQDYAPDAPFSE